MVSCFLGGLGDDRHLQVSANYASDVSNRHALLGDPMKPDSRPTLLERQPEEVRSIEPVHRGPAVEPLADICRDALLTRSGDESRNEGVIAVAVYRRRKAYQRDADSARSQR